ncbi:MAG TPA: hypothetical protein VLK30_03355 [Candidatus Limnocylindrales bacterium]|nr:hypothetical protein [Candidatus Limnocylindrales bacterium]
MKAFAVAGLLLATAACGAYQFPGESPAPSAAGATVSGRVVSVPCAPVQPAAGGCAARPVADLELDYLAGATVAGKAVTDPSGTYSVKLPAGSYEVRMRTALRVLSGPLKLILAAGSKTVANYTLDSGIRGPVPQQ